jgi:hypothetical protein
VHFDAGDVNAPYASQHPQGEEQGSTRLPRPIKGVLIGVVGQARGGGWREVSGVRRGQGKRLSERGEPGHKDTGLLVVALR